MEQLSPLTNYRAFKRAIVASVAVLIIFIVGFSVWKSVVEYRLTIRAAELQSRGYARALKEHADRSFSEADNILLDTIDHIRSRGGIEKMGGVHLRDFLDRHPRNVPQVGAIILINREGRLIAHTRATITRQTSIADRDYFLHHRSHPDSDAPFLSRPVKSRVNNKWRFFLSRPIRSANGDFDGLVAVAFEMEYFQKFYASLDLGKKGRIVILRKDGVMLMSQPYKESDFSVDFKKSHLIRTYLPKDASGTFHIASGKALLESAGRIISYESLESFPVVVNANMGTDEVTASWKKSTYTQGFITIAACLALISLTMLLLRQIKRIELVYRRQLEQQQEISQAAASWQSTFDSVADAIWVMDLDRRIQRCNKATETIFGKDQDRVVGHLCCEVAHHGAHPLATCPFQKMLDSGQRASMQLMISGRWFEVSVDPILDGTGTITGAVHIVSDITESKMAEERYRMLVDNLPVVTWQSDEHGNTYFISRVSEKIEGYTPEEIYAGGEALWFARVHPDDLQAVLKAFKGLFAGDDMYDVQYRIRHKEGHWIWVHDFAYATTLQGGVRVAHGVFSDVSARKQAEDERDELEMRLSQSQKMEAIGHLAGGIAHDFNNLLTPILGYAEMAVASIPDSDPLLTKLSGIIAAAHKAKDLTRQLLSFGRQRPVSAEPVDLNEVVISFNDILRRTVRESIRIDMILDPEGAYIKADRSQMEQIILNLTVNAQDAFNGVHGRINIETCRVTMDGESLRMHPGMAAGEYVLLSFRDNGCGMSTDVVSHIFEPFFTTKPVGHGTGLGLATVYGIVKQHGAHIAVTSHVGEGTTFNIYFPSCEQPDSMKPQITVAGTGKHSGDATVLLVEDNDMVREMVREMLEAAGYRIIATADPHRALELVAGNNVAVDLLVSDVVMPGMNGPELYERLVLHAPSLKVVYISGYPMNPAMRGGTLEDEVSYLQKPFTAEALLERILQVL
ncbi:MAG: hypothetical protein A2X82_03210 [Geobacteraceae bacterium GWC2_55_20]|nr:MAG: hypothetical protein A2X82_03210 [Geobacteraceae bacterium GWC2_55_20]OGU21682.1 MAG: hypothetical protein A2X85_01915 [Geobacteraceae bacterium GWF2_54_21]